MEYISETLLDAGYFRASIESLSDFDKIIGGMAWAMQLFKYDLSIDIYYADSLNLGQKILLTERLVMVLIIMNCPHQIQPHQIVGLDYVNILPVIKWLIGRFIEVRKDHLNRYLQSQPQRRATRSLPDDNDEYQIITYNEPRPSSAEFISTLCKSLENVKEKSKKIPDLGNQCVKLEDQEFPSDESKDANVTSGIDYSTALEARLGQKHDDGLTSVRNVSQDSQELASGSGGNGETANGNLVSHTIEDGELKSRELHRQLDSEILASNQEIIELVLKLDCLPSKLEIEQYQSRYIELNQQLISQSRDLRNLYGLFNTLDSSKHYLVKEINLLDSIIANLPLLDSSESNKSLLIVQLQDIIIKIKSVRTEVMAKLNTYKQKYESLMREYNKIY